MLIIYRIADGVVLHNSGTNSFMPEGPEFEVEVLNVIAKYGGESSDYAPYRLHDLDEAEKVQKVLTHSVSIAFEGETSVDVVVGEPLPQLNPGPMKPSADERISQLENEKKTLQLAVVDLFEQNLALEDKNKNVMIAVTDLFEMILPLLPEEGGAA